jgi:hypothetical protein
MSAPHTEGCTRRRFLGGLTVAGAAGLLGLHIRPAATEPSAETPTLRLVRVPSICQNPQYVAEEFLRDAEWGDLLTVEQPRCAVLLYVGC